ncbi:MAG: hypothetical protein V2A62_02880 [Candidatus Woesearchaeota archaeon]
MKKFLLWSVLFLICLSLALAATLKGSIYNSNLDLEKNVLVEVNSIPLQKMLAIDGTYVFNLPLGKYLLHAYTSNFVSNDEIEIVQEGDYVRDIFLIPSLGEEDTADEYANLTIVSENVLENNTNWYWIIGIVVLVVLIIAVIVYFLFKKRKVYLKEAEQKSVSELKEELAAEPGYLEETIAIIKKQGGRIHQKELRKEMLHLSESKISLILTELEHKGKIEKIKKGRGNAIILK